MPEAKSARRFDGAPSPPDDYPPDSMRAFSVCMVWQEATVLEITADLSSSC